MDAKQIRKQKKKKDPNAPKRALSAFMFFSNDIRETVKRERPDLAFLEIATEIGRRWQLLEPSNRSRYEALAEQDKQRYVDEKHEYIPDNGYEKLGRKKKDPDAPKRSLSAYLYFCNDRREEVKELNPGKKITEIATLLAERWRNLNDKDKEKYNKEAEIDKIRYQTQMESYNARKAQAQALMY